MKSLNWMALLPVLLYSSLFEVTSRSSALRHLDGWPCQIRLRSPKLWEVIKSYWATGESVSWCHTGSYTGHANPGRSVAFCCHAAPLVAPSWFPCFPKLIEGMVLGLPLQTDPPICDVWPAVCPKPATPPISFPSHLGWHREGATGNEAIWRLADPKQASQLLCYSSAVCGYQLEKS